jgi:hypothetical protein
MRGLHFEVKRTERLSLYDALEQAERDSGDNCPVVLHRRNRKRRTAIVYLDDLVDVGKVTNEINKVSFHERGIVVQEKERVI